MKRSVEVEYWVVDEDGALASPGGLATVSEYVEREFVEPLFELKTPPCDTAAELRSTFVDLLDRVVRRADELGRLLVPLGTPIHGAEIHRLPGERGRIQQAVLGTNLDYAKYCAGTHLHFEKRNVTDQLNALIALDPALALASSSPYFRGERIAAGARSYLYRKKCYEPLPKHGQLWDYVGTVGEWERRLDRRFEEFVAAAAEAGVAAERVERHFSPDDVVWTPVRLRDAMPTVEWRSPDAALPSQVLRLADEMGAVVEKLHHANVRVDGATGRVGDGEVVLPEFDALSRYVDDAIHDGLASDSVAAYLDRMGFDPGGYDPISARIDGRSYVAPGEAREIRRRYGERLRRDVADLRAAR